MKKVVKYQCDECGKLFDTESMCLEHEDRHKRTNEANTMLRNNCTLKEIQDKCNLWNYVPNHLENATTENCFIISHWQCCDKPAYRIIDIDMDGFVRLWGCGSWSGYYGHYISLHSNCLKNIRPKEELFVDKRYQEMYGDKL